MVLTVATVLATTGAGNAQERGNSSEFAGTVTLPIIDEKAVETMRRIGFEISDGVAFFPERRGEEVRWRLWHLFALMADPNVIEDRNFTMNFARALLPESALEPYVTMRMRVPYWRGDNEFQQEDSRRAFLDAHRSTLLALAPKMPMIFASTFSINFKPYDRAESLLTGSRRGQRPLEEIQHALPLFSGTSLELPMGEDEARQYVEGSFPSVRQAGLDYRPTLGIRYVVKDARLDKVGDQWGLGLDAELVDYALYADEGLTVSLLALPHPRNVRIYGAEESGSNKSLPVIDNFAKRLMVARMVPELGQSEPVIARLFEVRRQAERNAFRSGQEISFPPAIPRTVVNKDVLKPTAADLEEFVQWIARNAPKEGDHVLMDRVLHHGTAKRTLHNFWAHGGGAVYSGGGELIELARDASPDSFAFINTDNGIDEASQIVFALSTAGAHLWRDETLLADYAEPDQVQLEVQILHTAIRRRGNGKAVIIVGVHPVALHIRHGDGTETRRELPQVNQTVTQDRTDPTGSRFDILGVKLGMPVDEARKLLTEAYGGETRTAPPVSGANSERCGNTLASTSGLLRGRVGGLESKLMQIPIWRGAIKEQQEELGSDEPITSNQLLKLDADEKEAEEALVKARIDLVRDRYDALLAADCITADTPFDTSSGMEDLAKLVENRFSGAQFGVSSELPKTVSLDPVVAPGLTLAFASYVYPGEDHLLVFQANDDDGRPVVAGIYRTIRSGDLKKGASAFADGMSEKYGDPHFTSQERRVWLDAPDDPTIRRLFEFGDHACAVPSQWYETIVFTKNYLGNDCGVVLIGDHFRAALLDTRLIARAAEAAAAASGESDAAGKQAPAVRF